MNTINLLITTIVADDNSISRKSANRYNDTFLPVESFERFFDIDDCTPEN